MRRLVVAFALASLALPAAAAAQDEQSPPRWLFGFESRVGEAESQFTDDYSFGFIPAVSYYQSERLRIDGFVGLAWGDSDSYSLHLMPGIRYYLRPGPGKLRLNSGLSVGFELIEESGDYERLLREQFPDSFTAARDELLFVRLVPVELEYWRGRRGAFTVGLDYQLRLLDGGSVDHEGFGLTAGYRLRLK